MVASGRDRRGSTRLAAMRVAACLLGWTVLLPGRVATACAQPIALAAYLAVRGPAADLVFHYGSAPSQVVELFRPAGRGPFPVAILIHGGCWQSRYGGLPQFRAIGARLAARGIAAWNVEYRRLDEPGGGYPGTYQDVGTAIDWLASRAAALRLDTRRVVAVGHSAGAQLALWAAARARLPPASVLSVAHALAIPDVVSLGGLPDLEHDAQAIRQACGVDVAALTGLPDDNRPDVFLDTSAASMLPNGTSVIAITGELDAVAPPELAARYVDRVRVAGDPARAVVVPDAGHLDEAVLDSPVWPILEATIREVLHLPAR
ncbi:alpha/beta hydrolase family protein [Burkholderia gladioli]|uniref:alpha/beta hydrolase family protein n=1 Tax=Burkholderia gladioli TaxID=28095 RepID=UPI000BBD2642|nr:alpha/beta hydrolase [Burkholderia gladioli]ATF90140.1 alpha/beta hydrolase [Burkholderia gladioli pv. gladioli]MBU9166986.1 alpha/beta fold hydrolase [Burkholderia gladioli]MBU9381469.1 alpha/beta fold hydrolase [Burkholderia gladioli]